LCHAGSMDSSDSGAGLEPQDGPITGSVLYFFASCIISLQSSITLI